MTAVSPDARSGRPIERLDLGILAGLLVLSAILRFVALPSRGPWDADQGTEMLVLDRLIHAGQWPLLGPGVSVLGGTLHHGALFYYVLAPFALLSGVDPPTTILPIALAGVAAVALAWWLGRSIGGRWAGAASGLLAAVSATAIGASTTLWNPNLVPLGSLGAVCAAWAAWHGRPGWWGVAVAAFVAAIQFHLASVALVIPLAVLLFLDLRRSGPRRTAVATSIGWGLLAGVAMSLPLIVHELTNGFAEFRTFVAGISGGASGGGGQGGLEAMAGLVNRMVVATIRVLSWPLTGDLLAAPGAAALAAGGLAAGLVVRVRSSRGQERTGVVLLGGMLGGLSIILAIIAPGLASEVPALPVDHYHAFLDPFVLVAAGVVVAGLWQIGPLGRVLATVGLVALVGWNAAHWPPPVAPDGGWPAAEAAATRIIRSSGPGTIGFISVPAFKPPDGYVFPVVHLGRSSGDPASSETVVVVCDDRFVAAVGKACGGPAEQSAIDSASGTAGGAGPGGAGPGGAAAGLLRLVDRFVAGPDETISVYRRSTP